MMRDPSDATMHNHNGQRALPFWPRFPPPRKVQVLDGQWEFGFAQAIADVASMAYSQTSKIQFEGGRRVCVLRASDSRSKADTLNPNPNP